MRTILTGWNFMRFLRLGIGIYALVGAWMQREPLLAAAGGFLVLMALFNAGCCAGGACGTGYGRRSLSSKQEEAGITYEEIKSDEVK